MDINNLYQSNNLPSRTNNGGTLGYDVENEKRRISEGHIAVANDLLKKWQKENANAQIFPVSIVAMHPGVVDFLLTFNLVSVYDNITKQAGLDNKGRNSLPKVVWQIAQTKNWSGLDQILETNLQLVNSAHVTVVDLLKQNIINKIQAISESPIVQKIVENEEVVQKKETQLSLSQAMEKYPKIGDQNVTASQIKLRYSPAPVRPSIKNWITDFHDAMGSGKHSTVDRGNFLFHSENGKKLLPNERQKVALLLKSLDDETPLTIDTISESIIFGNLAAQSSVISQSSSNLPQQSQTQDIARAKANNISQPILNPSFQSGDNIVAPDDEMIQSQKVRDKVQGFFSKPTEEGKKENFFQIPQSKPPIGSDEYHVEKAVNNIQNTTTSRQSYSNEETRILNNKVADQDPDAVSDDELLERLRRKNTSPNFASNDGTISFSSAQKFSSEQSVKPELQTTSKIQPQSPPQRPALITSNKQLSQQHTISPYHIVPSGLTQKKNDELPKIQKNVVDLKN
jgi:hypothetical protein